MTDFLLIEYFDIERTFNLFFYLFISFSFFVGIVLMVSPEAFDALNRALSKEYGLKTRLIPKIEMTAIFILDKVVTKKRGYGILVGAIISIVSFVLILTKQ